MANFLHNLPLKIAKATNETEYDAVLADFEDFCKDNIGMTHFISQVKASGLE